MSDDGGHSRVESILRNPEPIMEYTPIAQSAPGRVCAQDGCTTVLSVYNHSAFCFAHQPDPDGHLIADCPPGHMVCLICGEAKPATIEFFYHESRRGGLRAWCRECAKEYNRRKKAGQEQRRPAFRICQTCKQALPLNELYFVTAPDMRWGFGNACRDCSARAHARARDRGERRKGDRSRRDYYYQKRYGVANRTEYLKMKEAQT